MTEEVSEETLLEQREIIEALEGIERSLPHDGDRARKRRYEAVREIPGYDEAGTRVLLEHGRKIAQAGGEFLCRCLAPSGFSSHGVLDQESRIFFRAPGVDGSRRTVRDSMMWASRRTFSSHPYYVEPKFAEAVSHEDLTGAEGQRTLLELYPPFPEIGEGEPDTVWPRMPVYSFEAHLSGPSGGVCNCSILSLQVRVYTGI